MSSASASRTSRDGADEHGAVADQAVGAGGGRARHAARHGGDRAAELGAEVGRRERAGALGRLDDHDDAGERGDQPVAGDEGPAVDAEPGRHLRDDGAGSADRDVEAALGRRVRAVDTAGEHGDRRRGAGQRASVRGRVDAERQPGHDAHAGRRQAAADVVGDREPVLRRAPGADHGDRVVEPDALRRTGDVQHGRRIGEVAQARRVARRRSGTPRSDRRRRWRCARGVGRTSRSGGGSRRGT